MRFLSFDGVPYSLNKPPTGPPWPKGGFFRFTHGAWILWLWLVFSGLSPSQQIQFNWLESVYDGTVQPLQTSLAGEPLDAAFTGRRIDFSSTETTFSNIPDSLALSYQSWAFSAKKTSMLGNIVQLGGTARVADHVEAVLVTWATADKYPEQAAIDPGGYQHPITATLYQPVVNADGTLVGIDKTLDRITATVRIPWRPTTLPDGSPYPYNGYAFKILIPLSANVILPNEILIGISFNTQANGDSPIGTTGPFDELNLALSPAPPNVGTDPDPNTLFPVINGKLTPTSGYRYTGSPMFSLATRETSLPTPILASSPVLLHAGTYHIRATVQPGNLTADAVTTILKAPAVINTSGLQKPLDSMEPGITVTTEPSGLSTVVTYSGSSLPPQIPGLHPFTVIVTDPDYSGDLSGTFHLTARSYDSWCEQWIHGLSPTLANGSADPDSDGRPNRMEYAMGSDPLRFDDVPAITRHDGSVQLIYNQRREMVGFTLTPQFSSDLRAWEPIDSVTKAEGDLVETKSVTCPPGRGFLRLRCIED